MRLSKNQKALYEKASNSFLYDDLYNFILSLWPDEIDTSRRNYVRYEDMAGLIVELEKLEDHQMFLEDCKIGNLFVLLDYALKIAIHKCGLCLDIVRPREINRSYVRFLFEDKSIGYAVTDNIENIPQRIRESLDSIYDLELVKEYFRRNKESQ